jgi:hypothetical protein
VRSSWLYVFLEIFASFEIANIMKQVDKICLRILWTWPAWHTCPGWYCNPQLLQPWFSTNPHSSPLPFQRNIFIAKNFRESLPKNSWTMAYTLAYPQLPLIIMMETQATTYCCLEPFGWESLWRWDLGHNLLLSQAFRWESVWRWDLGRNLLLSQAFRWESLWRWDLGFHGASGYHEAFSQTLPLFTIGFWLSRSLSHEIFLFSQWNSGYQEAFHTKFFFFYNGILAIRKPFTRTLFFFHDGILAIRKPFTNFLSHGGISVITEPFHEFFFHMMESRLSRSLSMNLSFTWWNLGYNGAFSRIFLSHDGISAITEPFHESFFHKMEFLKKMHDVGEDSFHIYHKEYLHRIRLIKNLASWFRAPLQGKEYGPPYSNVKAKKKANFFSPKSLIDSWFGF